MLVINSVQGEAVLTKYLGRKGLTVIIILPHIIFIIFKYVELLALIFSLFNIYTFDTICEN